MFLYSSKLAMSVLRLPRIIKRLIVFFGDASFCIIALWFAYYLRLGEWISLSGKPLIAVVLSLTFALPVFFWFGLYREVFRYSGWPTLITVAKACLVYGLMFACIIMSFGFPGIPRTIGIIQPVLLLILVGFSRIFASFWLADSYRSQLKLSTVPKALIYGAGSAGRQLAAALRNSNQMHVVGFIDDNKDLHGQTLNNIPIYSPSEIAKIANSLLVSDVLLALPSIGRRRRNAILEKISEFKLSVRTLPSVADLAKGYISINDIKELEIEDLLARDPIEPDQELLKSHLFGKVVLVTGAGGSIGSELCRQVLQQSPSMLILLEHNEFSLYSIEHELLKKYQEISNTQIVSILCSVRNEERINHLVKHYRPYIVFHAAAYKHVPLVEINPAEGIENNVFGTKVIAQAAQKYGVSRFILVSTDKAVRPTNIMGASKRLAEMFLQALAQNSNKYNGTIFSIVRFGNVLDSSGSVVPLFREQIKNGGPVTLTHLDVTRYFMTIPEAAQLVIQAGSMARGGEVFVLDMGEPVKIADLARHMIELSGLEVRDDDNPGGDIEIKVTGLRPGEKLFEELLIGDNAMPTSHPSILMADENFVSLHELQPLLESLAGCLSENSLDRIQTNLKSIVKEYQPSP